MQNGRQPTARDAGAIEGAIDAAIAALTVAYNGEQRADFSHALFKSGPGRRKAEMVLFEFS